MSLRIRKRLLLGVLGLLSIWPAVQSFLVREWNANPWELCGFAMYVQPNLPVEVRIRTPSGQPVEPDQLGSTVAMAFKRYREQAGTLGALAPTGELASALRSAGLGHAYVDLEMTRRVLTSEGTLGRRSRELRISLH